MKLRISKFLSCLRKGKANTTLEKANKTADKEESLDLPTKEHAELSQHAGEVFCQYIIGEMVQESKTLLTSSTKYHSFLNELKLIFGHECPGGVHVIATSLDTCNFYRYGAEDCVRMKCTDFEPIPLGKMRSGTIHLANQTLYYHGARSCTVTLHIVGGQATVELKRSHFVVGGICSISGVLIQLSQTDLARVLNGAYGQDEIKRELFEGGVFNSPNAMFQITNIALFDHSRALCNVQQRCGAMKKIRLLPTSTTEDADAYNQFRRVVIEAMGDDRDTQVLYENNGLKQKNSAFADLIDEVKILHGGVTVCSKLSSGARFQLDDEDKTLMWKVPIDAIVNGRDALFLAISGIVTYDDSGTGPAPPDFYHLKRNGKKVRVRYWFNGIIMEGILLIEDLNIEHHELFFALRGGELDFNVSSVMISMERIKETLKVLGIN